MNIFLGIYLTLVCMGLVSAFSLRFWKEPFWIATGLLFTAAFCPLTVIVLAVNAAYDSWSDRKVSRISH